MKIPYRFNPFGKSGSLTPQVNVVLGQIIEENGVKKFGVLSFNGTTGTVINSENFENVYSFNKITNNVYKRRLAYIEITGKQYINTGITPDFKNGDEIEIEYFLPNWTTAWSPVAFGSRVMAPGNILNNSFYGIGQAFIVADENNYTTVAASNYLTRGEKHIVHVSDSSITVDSNILTMPKRVTVEVPIWIGVLNQSNVPVTNTEALDHKYYYFKYWHNGALAQYLIPVMDFNDEPCFCDILSNTLIYNSGQGSFNYGELSGDDVELGQIVEVSGNQKFGSLSFDGTTPILKDTKTYSNTYTYNIEE